ncbi:MAG TPA: c-type cytochrome [Rhodanobacteraceae bacterium]|nr:c-type cytochrome [Rhodanobacteraceae bacterium]
MRFALFLALALAATGASAATPPARLGLCAACHGADGHARIPGAPNLAGQNYEYLMTALHAYRSGARDVAVMRAAIGPLSEDELQQLARWYSQLPCSPARAGH